MIYFKRSIILISMVFIFCQVSADDPTRVNDFPTKLRAEYVFACMSSNGQSEIMLEKCSCSIDTIAKMMTYDEYVNTETVLRMRQLSGDRVDVYRTTEWANKVVEAYRMAQAEAEVQCF